MRGMSHALTVSVLAVLIAVGISMPTQARDKFSLVHSFCTKGTHNACGDGSNPSGGLVMDAAGNFYGTTYGGGQEFGTVFELEAKGGGKLKFKTIYRFCHLGQCGINPTGALIIDTSGNLYGMAKDLVFELSPQAGKKPWSEKVLYNFCSQQNCTDGKSAIGSLTYAGASSGVPYDGVSPLYGATQLGGSNNGGTIFQLINNGGVWSESVLHSFCSQSGDGCTDGDGPSGSVILDASGNIYGLTFGGGGNGRVGVVFELSPSHSDQWTETVLYQFCSSSQCADGAFPIGSLTMDTTGNLFGVTAAGGNSCGPDPSGCGTIFKIAPNEAETQQTVLYAFCAKKDCRDGHSPQAGLVLDSQGNLFGTTEFGGGNDDDVNGLGGGVAFKLSPGASEYKILHSFCLAANCADGEYPLAGLAMDSSGDLFGTTSLGGEAGDETSGGVVFKLSQK